jgi:hypothetical protein
MITYPFSVPPRGGTKEVQALRPWLLEIWFKHQECDPCLRGVDLRCTVLHVIVLHAFLSEALHKTEAESTNIFVYFLSVDERALPGSSDISLVPCLC